MLKGLLDRAQGKPRVKEICNKVFKEYADSTNLIPLDNLQVAVLRVYNNLNKNLFGPHKEPPSVSTIENQRNICSSSATGIDEDRFYNLILEWTKKDLRNYVAHKVVLSLLAAPSLAVVTKNAGERVPRIGPLVEKIPATVFFPFYSVGLVLLL